MQWIKNLVARFVAALVCGHDLIVMDNLNAIDVALDCHGLEGRRARNAVTHVVEACELILIDFRRLADAGIKAMLGQSRRLLEVLLQPLANRALRIAPGTRSIIPATVPQVFVQFLKVLHAGNRGPPTSLQRLHTIFDNRFLVAAGRHAKQRLEHVVARQCRVIPVHFTVTSS